MYRLYRLYRFQGVSDGFACPCGQLPETGAQVSGKPRSQGRAVRHCYASAGRGHARDRHNRTVNRSALPTRIEGKGPDPRGGRPDMAVPRSLGGMPETGDTERSTGPLRRLNEGEARTLRPAAASPRICWIFSAGAGGRMESRCRTGGRDDRKYPLRFPAPCMHPGCWRIRGRPFRSTPWVFSASLSSSNAWFAVQLPCRFRAGKKNRLRSLNPILSEARSRQKKTVGM